MRIQVGEFLPAVNADNVRSVARGHLLVRVQCDENDAAVGIDDLQRAQKTVSNKSNSSYIAF